MCLSEVSAIGYKKKILKYRLRWNVHVAPMRNKRIPKQHLYAKLANGRWPNLKPTRSQE